MEWPELFELVVMAMAAASVLLEPWVGFRRPLLALALVAGAAEGWYRVAPWQMLPVALAWVVLVWAYRRQPQTVSMVSGGIALSLISTSAGLLIVLPFFALPKPTGLYAVGTLIVTLGDSSRELDGSRKWNKHGMDRELEVQIWYPAEAHSGGLREPYVRAAEMKPMLAYQAGIRTNAMRVAPIASAGGPFPVLIYGHSWGSRRSVDTFLCEELASHGYVVVAVDHPLNSARMELPDGTVIRSDRASALSAPDRTGTQATLKLWADELAIWVADDRFVLRRLAAAEGAQQLGWLRGRVDLSRVGAFGHSFGGASSFALLGQPEQAGVPVVRAAANLDGWTFQGLDRRTDEPILMVYAGEPFDAAAVPEPVVNGELDRADRAALMQSVSAHGGTVLYVPRTQHLDFTDQTLVSPFQRLTYTGPMDGERIRTITRAMLVGFFDKALKGSGQGTPAYPEVKSR